jgi:hypothetical protein
MLINVSEECTASIIMVEELAKQPTSKKYQQADLPTCWLFPLGKFLPDYTALSFFYDSC